MRPKYKVSLIIILISLLCTVFIAFNYRNFLHFKENTMAMIKVKSGLSINYLNGNRVQTNEDTYELDFSITNTQSEPIYYYIKLLNNVSNSEISYKLVNLEGIINDLSDNLTKNNLVNMVAIEPGQTHNFSLIFYNPHKKEIDSELSIDLAKVDSSLKSNILKTNKVVSQEEADYENGTSEASYLLELDLEDEPTYYFRGNASNNYVLLANYLWRIVKINADGTSLLVLNEPLEDSSPINASNENSLTTFLDSTIYQNLANFYDENLKDVDELIANAKYCTDDNAQSEEEGTIFYLPNTRIFTNFAPVATCPGTTSTAKIGLLTADDIMFAGGTTIANKSYYLYTPSIWWTMTLQKKENGQYYYIGVDENGSLLQDQLETNTYRIRPAITLIKKLSTTGVGTLEDPFVVKAM